MNGGPAVLVRKTGFLSALCYGVFGFLTVTVMCVAGLGFRAISVIDSRAGNVFSLSENLVENLPVWIEHLPPAVADALDDRRAPEYRKELECDVRLVRSKDNSRWCDAVVEVTNNGDRAVSLLTLNVVLENARGVPLRDFRTFAATPLALESDEWRGPLLPGSTRKFSRRVYVERDEAEACAVEISTLRVFRAAETSLAAAP